MSTEYRRGIPSTAHIEAAMRLELLWYRESSNDTYVRFAVAGEQVLSRISTVLGLIEEPVVSVWPHEGDFSYRPIRPDGTPVDWDVLDREVARVGQQGQPQGFRPDLWARLNEWITANWLNTLGDIEAVNDRGISGRSRRYSWDELGLDTETDEADRQALIARWTVYQELKPLYDLVDGAQGEAAMPRDVEAEWFTAATMPVPASGHWFLCCDTRGIHTRNHRYVTWRPEEAGYGAPLRNFAAVLDAVAERRVAERMRGQTPANPDAVPTVTPARRFADVRPDRHGWRWWRIVGAPDVEAVGARFEVSREQWSWLAMADGSAPTGNLVGNHPWTHSGVWDARTVIPTDEQGNPVSWEAAGFAAEAVHEAQETMQQAINDVTPSRSVGDIEWTVTGQPVTRDMTVEPATGNREAEQHGVPGVHITVGTKPAQTEAITTLPLPLPRFTADELNNVDHSKTTKLNEVTLRRGKLPTVEQIAKYREVRARRTGGAVADALKESRIDCEVAQYVLERWAGGLGDAQVRSLLGAVGCVTPLAGALPSALKTFDPTKDRVDHCAQHRLRNFNPTLDTSEKPSPIAQRERQEAEERRQRLAELRQRLAAERAAQSAEEMPTTTSRFDLIEPDPQADPTASIRAWEARQAAAKARPVAAPARPAAVPRRPAIEVVDAEVDGLSRSEAFAALFGRALNGGC